jgi:hypothetical protein
LPPGFETSPVNEDVIDATQRTKKIQRTQRAQKTQSPEQELKKPINTNTDTNTKQLGGNKLLLETELGKDFCVCLKVWISSVICSDLFTFNGLELEAIVCFVEFSLTVVLIFAKKYKPNNVYPEHNC